MQITPEIEQMAQSLDNNPLEIFRHIYNHYDYTPYYGSMKGSLDTYYAKEGNDYDLSSLLIALLGAAGIPARYVRAKIMVPVEQIERWVDIEGPMAALQYLSTAGTVLGYYTSGGKISHAYIEHVLVEAYLPYANYRGTLEDDSGSLWIPMDPAFKQYRVLQPGVDLAAEMDYDWHAFWYDYWDRLRNASPIEHYGQLIDAHIADQHPNQSLDQLKRKIELVGRQFDFLPNTLPYRVAELMDRFAAIPDAMRHTLRFNIPAYLDFSISLPQVAGRRITLCFDAAGQEDQQIIDAYGGIFNTPPYLIRVKPVLRIDGQPAAPGEPMDAGINMAMHITYQAPGKPAQVIEHLVLSGSYNGIGVVSGRIRQKYLTVSQVEGSEEPYIAKLVHNQAMQFYQHAADADRLLADSMRIKSRMLFAEAMVSTRHDRRMIFGVPSGFDFAGYQIDAQALEVVRRPVSGYDHQRAMNFHMTSGLHASFLENRTFEDNFFWISGLSATKGLQILKALDVPVVELAPPARFINYSLPYTLVDDINNALNRSWHVIAPTADGDLPAVPYIKYDPKTGGAGFMIAAAAGGYAFGINPQGADMEFYFTGDFGEKGAYANTIEVLSPASPHILPLGEGFGLSFKGIAQLPFGPVERTKHKIIDTDWTGYTPGHWPMYARSG